MENNTTAIATSHVPATITKVVALDAKLTRGEALDLLMEDIAKDLHASLAEAEAEVQAATQALESGLTVADVAPLLTTARVKIVTNDWNSAKKEYISVIADIPQGHSKAAALIERYKAAVARRMSIRDHIYKMESSKTAFKSQVLRTMLAGTPEGRAMLEALASAKLAIKAKFLGDQATSGE